MSLYDIDTELAKLEEKLIEGGGVLNEEDEAAFDYLNGMKQDKLVAYFNFIRNMQATEKAVKEEADRWAKKKKAISSSIAFLKSRLHQSMIESRMEKIDLGLKRKISVVKSSARKTVPMFTDVSSLPSNFVIEQPVPDTKYMKELYLEAEKELAECSHIYDEEGTDEALQALKIAETQMSNISKYIRVEEAGTHVRISG